MLVRVNHKTLQLHDASGRRLSIRQRLRGLRMGQVGEWVAWVHGPDDRVAGRQAAKAARARMRWHARRKQRRVTAEATLLAGFVFVWTDLSGPDWAAGRVLDLYRLRWQIELVFKRMKSILGLGRLPKSTDGSCRAWLHGKLLLALLTDRLLESADRFSPWGYRLDPSPQPVA